MKISVIGTGYVGLVTGTSFAEMGNDVWCIDVDEKKIDKLNQGIIPIYEPGLKEMVLNNVENGLLHFTTDSADAIGRTDICIIAVGTPMRADGSANLDYVLGAAADIGKYMMHHMYIIDKSTVPVGTSEKVRAAVQAELGKRCSDLTFDVISNPEFLKEGTAIEDCQRPDRIVVGVDNQRAEKLMRELYKPFVLNTGNFIIMDIASAEMTKYTANAMLATKISFINEISNICERVGADVNKVRKGVGSDRRIGYSFIYPGCGYGGSCFPKDVQALISTAGEHGYQAKILQSVEAVNQEQKLVLPRKVKKEFGEDLTGKTFAVWGLAFKPGTDDMREASSITLLHELMAAGAQIKAYDPKAMKNAQNHFLSDLSGIQYCKSKYEALQDADALILVTEWKEFRSPDFGEIAKQLKTPLIIDGRNQFDEATLAEYGLRYIQIGVA